MTATFTITGENICPGVNYSGYRGTTGKTLSGKTCQKWTETSPHSHSSTDDTVPQQRSRRSQLL